MSRVVIVNTRHDSLAAALMKLVPDAVAASSFHLTLEERDVLCWLPAASDPVDDQVNALAHLLDESVMQPSRIIMLSIGGTEDGTAAAQLKQWYGHNALGKVMAYQYAIKMIDELELPYTVVRTAPLDEKTTSQQKTAIVASDADLVGHKLGIPALASFLDLIIENDVYTNRSVGLTVKQ